MISEKSIKKWAVWHHKVGGILLILFGILLYLKNTGAIPQEIFWPSVAIGLGLVALAEVSLLWKKI